MNKPEVIEKIKSKSVVVSDRNIDYRDTMVSMSDVLNIIEQLDEPEKPVVPQCVADWYESRKDYFEWSLSHIGLDVMNGVFEDNTEMYDWLNSGSNKPIETLVKMKLFGYEVEKEKLYTVEIPSPHDTCHVILFKNKDGNVTIEYDYDDNWETEKGYQLTEEEIKEDFAWAWQFAEEVKE